ncbi:MAG: aminotransferase class I/II-fold pyridoxal phosphate-dependent enzyme [Candidatus Lokiarchaeota archaeon]|nr:aminotransferase class I/II-fold pyridoxal phosphate-dependent enzyme [Candidatus Lokiarchaeota archaeon]
MKTIDLRSDTITQPTDEMIDAIAAAHKAGRFGDDVIGEDEVVHELQDKTARILGKEKALLVTSGTQGNVISLLAQTCRGEEVVVENQSHTFLFEAGSMASLGGLFPKPVEGIRGYISPTTLEKAISVDDAHYAKTSMVVVENTHNYAGGTITRPEQVQALAQVAHEHGLKVHCDGARLFNAAVGLGIKAKKLVEHVDSVQICCSKGLSAPVGSMIAGTEDFIHEAHRVRKRLGGGMRQAGIIAAPMIIALEKMVDRLIEDHDNAKLLYKRLVEIEGLVLDEPDTNIIFIDLRNFDIDTQKLSAELEKRGVLVYGGYGTRTRFVLNRMVDSKDVQYVADSVVEILGGS